MIMRFVHTLASFCATVGLWVSAALLVYVVVHVDVEIVMRNFFGKSTNSMNEYVGYALGAMTFLALSHTFRSRKHIRVSLTRTFTSGRIAVAVELICLTLTFVIMAFLTSNIWNTLFRDFKRGSVSPTMTETPTWYIDAAIFIGLIFLLIQIFSSALVVISEGVPEDSFEGD